MGPLGPYGADLCPPKLHMGPLGPIWAGSVAWQPQSLARQPQSLAQQPQCLAQQPQSLAQQQLWLQQQVWRQQKVWRRARGCAVRELLCLLAPYLLLAL